MAFSVTHVIGADFTAVAPSGTTSPFSVGVVSIGSDGKLYVYGQANASITASTAVCTVNASTFLATATGGSYTSPATNLVSGDRGWFSKALV